MAHDIHIIGGGLAGSEATWQLAQRGFRVLCLERREDPATTKVRVMDWRSNGGCKNSKMTSIQKAFLALVAHPMNTLLGGGLTRVCTVPTCAVASSHVPDGN